MYGNILCSAITTDQASDIFFLHTPISLRPADMFFSVHVAVFWLQYTSGQSQVTVKTV
jgi:hypothetical protein